MINRAVLILKIQQLGIDWINKYNPDGEEDLTMDEANMENTAYLISEEDSESPDTLNEWLELNYQKLFESELESWLSEQELWPKDMSFSTFKQWFKFDCHTIVIDTVPIPIADIDDELNDNELDGTFH